MRFIASDVKSGRASRVRSLIGLALGVSAILVGSLSFADPKANVLSQSPAPDPAKLAALGKQLFNDKTLSNPPGMACVTCHDSSTGYSYPNSVVNSFFGVVPGVVKGRVGNRRPPSAAYAPFMPAGVPHYDQTAMAWVGGLFWDGRAYDALAQAKFPFQNPNEMNNWENGAGSPEMVINKVKTGPSADMFREVYGDKVFEKPVGEVFTLVARAIVAYEASPEVSPFTSKYDAYLEGKAELTPQELLGLRLATGTLNGRPGGLPFKKSAHCMDCHGASADLTKARDIWTNSCYANLGIPRNNNSSYFLQTDRASNPGGHNPDGPGYIDPGMGDFIYGYMGMPELNGMDPFRIMGTFKAPTLRNVDKRPYPGFVKAYMHNGYFKSLKEVVHFYNSRNLTTEPGEVIDFSAPDPYKGLKGKPLFAPPEFMNPWTLINPSGKTVGPGARVAVAPGPTGDLDAFQIGNLRLSESQEDAIVAFLKCLTDGYFERK